MAELSSAMAGAKPRQKVVLSAGHNAALLRARNTLMEAAGYQVVTTRESTLVVELAKKQRFDAVVMCSSIPAHLAEAAARELKAFDPALPLVVICIAADCPRFTGLAETIAAEYGVSQPLIEVITRLAGQPDGA
jgi:DNA-binding NtrC family response regulator